MASPPARAADECAGECCSTRRHLDAPPRELLLHMCSGTTEHGVNVSPDDTTQDTSRPLHHARDHVDAPSHDDHLAQVVTSFLAGRAFAYANGDKEQQARALLAAVRGQRDPTPGDARAQQQRRNFVRRAKAAARADGVDLSVRRG